MKKTTFLFLLLCFSCEEETNSNQNSEFLIVASEGNYGDSNGSITMFNGNEKIHTLENVGDVVQSILVHDDKLFVAVNNSHLIKRFTITETGLQLPGIQINTQNSGPREMVVLEGNLYFTNWFSKDIKVLNLTTFSIEESISIDGVPEDIITDGKDLWVSVPSVDIYDQGYGTSVVKINPITKAIEEVYEVGNGPQNLLLDGEKLWVSRTFYSSDWSTAYFGSSLIDLNTKEVEMKTYGAGMICGGNLLKLNNQVYRTVDGGVAPIDQNLDIKLSLKIGSYGSLYSASSSNQNIYLGRSDGVAPDSVFVHDENGNLQYNLMLESAYPGDYEFWEPN